MSRVGRGLWFAFVFLFVAAPAVWARPQPPGPEQRKQHAKEREGILVGRISFVEGELLRYVPEEKDWVLTVKDTPFGLEDALYSGDGGKAEFLMPNSTWARIGPDTQIQMIALKPDATEIDVASGTARFVNRSSKAVIKATTPFGCVVAEPGSSFDLYVGDESVEAVGIEGRVAFIHDADGSRYDVVPGAMSVLADGKQATAGEGKVDADWDDWNSGRDTMWSKSLETKGESVRYLPEGIREDANVLDENGRWERVNYEGEYRDAWRPTTVEQDWAPYTAGRWTDWYGDSCWVPDEPFGYVTHHYGNWFWANNYWYWAPPVVSVGFGVPYWGVGFSWYPGRVGWLYSGASVGWFPLLPWEPFYAYHWWGPSCFVVNRYGSINVNVNRYRHVNRAVFVNHNHLYGANNYRSVRLNNVNRNTIASQFRGTPTVNNGALRNAGDPNRRFRYTNADPSAKPGAATASRVAQNQARSNRGASGINGRTIRQQASGAKRARLAANGSVAAPRSANRSVSGTSAAGDGQRRALNRNPRSVSATSARTAVSAAERRGARRSSAQGRDANTRGSRYRKESRSAARSGEALNGHRKRTASRGQGRVGQRGERSSRTTWSDGRQRSYRSRQESARGRTGSRSGYERGRQSGFERARQSRYDRGYSGGNARAGRGRSAPGTQGRSGGNAYREQNQSQGKSGSRQQGGGFR